MERERETGEETEPQNVKHNVPKFGRKSGRLHCVFFENFPNFYLSIDRPMCLEERDTDRDEKESISE